MNDVYKLHQEGKNFIWELIEAAGSAPDPRTSFGAVIASDDQFYLFGGSGDNNIKFNDLWEFKANQWICLSKGSPFSLEHDQAAESHKGSDEVPLHKSGHQITLVNNKYIVVFGGIHEVTYEMNDLKAFDVTTKKWQTIEEENKNLPDAGSPKTKSVLIGQDTKKINTFAGSKGTATLNLDGTLQMTVQSPKKGNLTMQGMASPTARFNNNPFLTIQNRSLSATKRLEAEKQQESTKEHAAGEGLLTPTSIQLKNAFIIKNADASFDQYYTMMKKRKGYHSPGKSHAGNLNFAPLHGGASTQKDDSAIKVRIINDKQPAGRDGLSSAMHQGKWIIFGGDRHHMPFNDTFVLDTAKLALP